MQNIKHIFAIIWRNPNYSMPAILLIWGLLYFFFGAIINRNNGLGFDGATYGSIIKNFYDIVLNQKLTLYQIQRIFPLFLVNTILTIINLPKEDFYIIKVFQIYNLCLLTACTYLWYKISVIYKLDLKYIWLGYIFAFLNFGVVRISFFYPVLTDTTAYFLGFCLLYFHLKDNLGGKLLITFLGAFTWPSFIYIGILLIIFPVNTSIDLNFTNENKKGSLNIGIALLMPLIFFAVSIFNVNKYFSGEGFYDVLTPMFISLLYVNAFLNLLFMTYLFYTFLPGSMTFYSVKLMLQKIFAHVKIKNVAVCTGIFILIHFIQKVLSNDSDPVITFQLYFYYIAVYAVTKPFVYFITSVTYLGPCFIILFFLMKNYKAHLYSLGVGAYVSFMITFVLIFLSETRVILNYFPFIILLTVLVLKDFNITKTIFGLLCIFSFILSKIFIPMDKVPADNAIRPEFFDFPNQLFFMNSYMISKAAYFIQGAIILVMTFIVITKIKKSRVKPVNSQDTLQARLADT